MPRRAVTGPTPAVIETTYNNWQRHLALFGVVGATAGWPPGTTARLPPVAERLPTRPDKPRGSHDEQSASHKPPPKSPEGEHSVSGSPLALGPSAGRLSGGDGQSASHKPDLLGSLPLEIFLMIADRAGMVAKLNLGLTCKSFYLHLKHYLGPEGLNACLILAVCSLKEDDVRRYIRLVNPDGGGLLFDATVCRSSSMVRLLLNSGVDPNERDIDGYTPLHYATKEGDTEIMRLLLHAHGIEKNAKTDILGWTPLHFATFDDRRDLVTLLCEHGVDVNAIDMMGCTALHIVYMYRRNSIKSVLIENKASNRIHDNLGVHPSGYFFKINQGLFRRIFSCDISIHSGGGTHNLWPSSVGWALWMS